MGLLALWLTPMMADAKQDRIQLAQMVDGYKLTREEIRHHLAAGKRALLRGDYNRAKRHYLRVLKLDPSNSSARQGLRLVQLALPTKKPRITKMLGMAGEALRRKKYTEAIILYLKVLRLSPGHRGAAQGLKKAELLLKAEQKTLAAQRRKNRPLPPKVVTALLAAAAAGNLSRVKAIVGKYPRAVHSRNAQGETALHLASYTRQTKVMAFLLKSGAKVNAKNKKGKNTFDYLLDGGCGCGMDRRVNQLNSCGNTNFDCDSPYKLLQQYGVK